eukprot:5249580-Amphidinium_carterae.1
MLPHGELAEIWKLSDKDLDGQLSAAEFTVAMHLVFRRRQGVELPPELPLELAITAEAPQLSEEPWDPSGELAAFEASTATWTLEPWELDSYKNEFRKLDKRGTGVVGLQDA